MFYYTPAGNERYLKMKKVDKDEFFNGVGPFDVHPIPVDSGTADQISEWRLRGASGSFERGELVGLSVQRLYGKMGTEYFVADN